MPDTRSHRGAHPEDPEDFAPGAEVRLRTATAELSYLLSRDYSDVAALKLVGDRHQLTARQRKAVQRAACPDGALRDRVPKRLAPQALRGATLGVDGFNCLITVEAMLSGAPVFRGRDGALRDLASVHGTYRSVQETEPALRAMKRLFTRLGLAAAHFYFDRPVGNSGRIKALALELFRDGPTAVSVSLHDLVDRELVAAFPWVASSDSWILDQAAGWFDLGAALAEAEGLSLWCLDLSR